MLTRCKLQFVHRIPPPTISKSDVHPREKGKTKINDTRAIKETTKNPPKICMHTMYKIQNTGEEYIQKPQMYSPVNLLIVNSIN